MIIGGFPLTSFEKPLDFPGLTDLYQRDQSLGVIFHFSPFGCVLFVLEGVDLDTYTSNRLRGQKFFQ